MLNPKLKAYKIKDYRIDVEFGKVYSEKFDFLNSVKPNSIILVEGLEITIKE